MINIVLFGPPGAGKGVQSTRLLQRYPLQHISPGNLFRHEIQQGSPRGELLQSYMAQGNLLPEEIVIQTVGDLLKNTRKNSPQQAFLFDGYPRSTQQAHALQQQLAALHTKLHLFVILEADPDTIQKRLSIRRKIEGRHDDQEDKVAHRLAQYAQYGEPTIACYPQDIILRLEGTGTPEEIHRHICSAIDNLLP